jgi:hypothetical protein
MNKKASMELGINTVVVLVIAMVIIAGGIAFIRGFFKLGEDKLGSAFNIGDFGNKPSSTDPLVLTDGNPVIKSSGTEKFRVGFYNRGSGTVEVEIEFTDCKSTGENPNCEEPVPQIQSLSQKVEPGESAGFENYITAKCKNQEGALIALSKGEYICTITASLVTGEENAVESKQITFTVES